MSFSTRVLCEAAAVSAIFIICTCGSSNASVSKDSSPIETSASNAADKDHAALPNVACPTKNCGIAMHGVTKGAETFCVSDEKPIAIDCPLPKETKDPLTAGILYKTRFLLPEDATPHENKAIGPFCCTGKTLVVLNPGNLESAYAHFFWWEEQAFLVGDTSYVNDLTINIAGRNDVPPGYSQNAIHFLSEELAACVTHHAHAGGFDFTVRPSHVDVWRPACLKGDLGYDMGTLTMVLDIRHTP